MKKRLITAAFAGLATLAAGGASAADRDGYNDGWYGGLRLGRTTENLGGGAIDSALGNQGLAGASALDHRATGWGLFAGYQVNRNFALEGGYDQLGRFNYSSAVSSPAADTVSGRFDAHAFDLSAVGILPIAPGWSAFGKAGIAYSEAKLDAGSTGAVAVSSQHHWSTEPLLGGGISVDVTRNVFVRAEWDRFLHVGDSNTGRGDIDMYTVGVGYHF